MGFGTHIFFTTVGGVFLILSYATYVGRLPVLFFPPALRPALQFYLAPAFGLAFTLVFIAAFGRYRPFGDSVVFPLLIAAALVLATALEQEKKKAFLHAITVGAFGLASCAALLSSLYVAGALNPHNDTFTYIAQGDWLQHSPFRDIVSDRTVTPAATQVSLYQHEGFRMGGTYLLGLFQSLLNVRWSFDIYPAVVCSSVAAACLASGYPAARVMTSWPVWMRLAPLTIIGNSLGGLSFAAHFGFMPQGFGILFGAALLFSYGTLLPVLGNKATTAREAAAFALPSALLLSASIFSYSEVAPFLIASAGLSTLVAAIYFRSIRNYLVFAAATLVLGAAFLNVEILRSYRALIVQSSAVVGSPIDWSLIGYIAHAIGLHGGGWDVAQWTLGGAKLMAGRWPLLAMAVLAIFAVAGAIMRRRDRSAIELLPTFLIVVIFSAGLLYFRYVAKNPFPVGTGQSWSQFKLSDWAHVFVSGLLLSFILPVAVRIPFAKPIFATAALVGIAFGISTGDGRSQSVIAYYNDGDLSRHLRTLRGVVLDVCRERGQFYLDLEGNDHKYRQLIAVVLADRYIKSNWKDDGYIAQSLPEKRRNEAMDENDCIIESASQSQSTEGVVVGPARIRAGADPKGEISIRIATSVNHRETDGKNWWLWVSKKASFDVSARAIPKHAAGTRLMFSTASEWAQPVTLTIEKSGGQTQREILNIPAGVADYSFAMSETPQQIKSITFDAKTEPKQLGPADPRTANFMLRNMRMQID